MRKILYIILYDFPKNAEKYRKKARNIMKDYNGKWIQYSAYIGEFNPIQIQQLLKKLEKLAKQERTSIIIIPIPKNTPQWIEYSNKNEKTQETIKYLKQKGIKIKQIKPETGA